MRRISTSVVALLDVAVRYLFLNVVWLLGCLPILTIPASTTAMTGVVRQWAGGDEAPVLPAYFRQFRKQFRVSTTVGFVAVLLAGLLLIDLMLIGQMGALRRPMLVLTGCLSVIYVLTAVNLLSTIVEQDVRSVVVIRESFLLGLSQPLVAAAIAAVVGGAALLIWIFPPAILLGSSIAATCNSLSSLARRRTNANVRRAAAVG